MTRGKTPSPAASLHEQTVRQHCRALKMPTVAGQFETLAQAAIREGHGHVQYLDALLTASMEYDADGHSMGFQGIIRDITEQKRVEEALRTSEEWLQLALDAAQMGQWD